MRFTITSAIVAFAASALAQTEGFDAINIPEENQVIPAGSTFEVKWDAPATYLTGTISISLIGGADQGSLQPIAEIDSKSQLYAPDFDVLCCLKNCRGC